MSVDSIVVIRDARLPTIDQWQAALDRAGTGIVLENVGDLREQFGYVPVIHRGHASGFEWFYTTVQEFFDDDPPDGLGDRTHVVDLITHSDSREFVCARIAGAVLADLTDGLVGDDNSDTFISGSEALEIARGLEEELRER